MQKFPFFFLLGVVSAVAFLPAVARAYDARPFCDARALAIAEKKVLDVPRRIGVDFSIEPSKDLPPPVANPADLRELPPLFLERFRVLEKALFGRNGVLKLSGSANHRDGRASLEPGYGVVLEDVFAALLLKERPEDSGLIDIVIAHELGHYVQNNYLEVDKANVLVKDASNLSRFLVSPAVEEKIGRILAKRDEFSRELNASAATHAEVTWIGLAIMKKAGAPLRLDALAQLKRIRDSLVHESQDPEVSLEQLLNFNTVEFTLVDCAVKAVGAR